MLGRPEPSDGGRTFLEDGDEVVLRYTAPGADGGRITLGEVAGRIEPARPTPPETRPPAWTHDVPLRGNRLGACATLPPWAS